MDELNIWTIETGESGNNSAEGVNEQDIQRVQEEARQIKQVAQQLKKNKAANGQFAGFLSFLMKTLDDEIITQIYDTFYMTTDTKTGITYLRKNANYIVICGIFFPFFREEASKYNLHKLFWPLLPNDLTIKSYLKYLQSISNKYHDNIPLKQDHLIHLLFLIFQKYLFNCNDAPKLKEWDNPELSYKNLITQYLNE